MNEQNAPMLTLEPEFETPALTLNPEEIMAEENKPEAKPVDIEDTLNDAAINF